jgi:hypothetical protein
MLPITTHQPQSTWLYQTIKAWAYAFTSHNPYHRRANMKTKKTAIILLVLTSILLLGLASCGRTDDTVQDTQSGNAPNANAPSGNGGSTTHFIGTANQQGNTAGNILNGGLAAQQGDWVYVRNMPQPADAQPGRTNFRQIRLTDLNVIGDWVYGLNEREQQLMRASSNPDTDGFNAVTGTDGNPLTDRMEGLHVVGDWVYYVNLSADRRIYKIKTDLTGKERLNDLPAQYLNVAGDWIYYAGTGTNREVDGNLYKMRTDGTEHQQIWNREQVSVQGIIGFPLVTGIIVHGDWMYVTFDSRFVYKIRTDGTELQNFFDDGTEVWNYNVFDGRLYYANRFNNALYSIRFDGTDPIQYHAANGEEIRAASRGIYVTEDWVFYYNLWLQSSIVPRGGVWQ